MGYYTNYEIMFNEHVDWDDQVIKNNFTNYSCKWLYLRDMNEMIIIFSLYSYHEIKDVLDILSNIYQVDIKYRIYGAIEWNYNF